MGLSKCFYIKHVELSGHLVILIFGHVHTYAMIEVFIPRYKNVPRSTKDEKIVSLYDTDNKEEMRYLEEKFLTKTYFDSLAYQNITRRCPSPSSS